MGILDLVFPKTCVGCSKWGNYLCTACEQKINYLSNQFCSECARAAIAGRTHPQCKKKYSLDGLISLTFLTFPVNKLIHSFKYRYTTDLANELIEKVMLRLSAFTEKAILVPIPLHNKRQNLRGFNQAEILGKIYAGKFGLDFAPNLLKRAVNTTPQVGLKKTERQENVRGVFEVTGDVEGKDIIVFDDVWTTGATIRNAGQALKRRGARKVWGLTLARSH